MSQTSQHRYGKLIAFAQARASLPGYVEMHHIVPRSAGGADTAENLVALTAREHFLAHWLLYRIYRTPASARAFKLMVHDQNKRRGRDYAAARQLMAESMRGANNVAKRPEVRAKLKESCYSAFAGKKRPEHSKKMQDRQQWVGVNNPWFGAGERQVGAKNHMARKVVGVHPFAGVSIWDTATATAKDLGVSLQAVVQAIKNRNRSKGWRLEFAK